MCRSLLQYQAVEPPGATHANRCIGDARDAVGAKSAFYDASRAILIFYQWGSEQRRQVNAAGSLLAMSTSFGITDVKPRRLSHPRRHAYLP